MKKRYLITFFATLLSLAGLAQGEYGVDGAFHPRGRFPIVLSSEVKGGPKWALDLATRDAIDTSLRQVGMWCFVNSTQRFYYLSGGTTNSNWTELVLTDTALTRIVDSLRSTPIRVINNLTTNTPGQPLDAYQGYVLKGLVDNSAVSISANRDSLLAHRVALTANAALTALNRTDLDAVTTQVNALPSTYLKQTDAASTYATKTSLNSYLLSSTAASTYATQVSLNSYLLSSTAASTYATQVSLANYLLSATAASTYLSQATAASTYLSQATASSTYATIASLNGYLLSSTAASTYVYKVGASDIEITDATKGIILRTADGTRARVTLVKYNGILTLQVSDPL
jgi:hypothetical protein